MFDSWPIAVEGLPCGILGLRNLGFSDLGTVKFKLAHCGSKLCGYAGASMSIRYRAAATAALGQKRMWNSPGTMSAIGGKTDMTQTFPLRQVMTQLRHWLCTAAMVLMPVSTPIKVLD